MTRRLFNGSEKVALYLSAGGRCSLCQAELQPGWHADHVDPYMNGGATDVVNGQALCPACNLAKGSETSMTLTGELREWQEEARRRFRKMGDPADFLVAATPGAGKTRLAITMVQQLLRTNAVERAVVVVPTDALRLQWADCAGREGLNLMPVSVPEDYDKPGYSGCVVTYAQLARGVGSDLVRVSTRTPTVAILDEIHHAGRSRSWGDGLENALGLAKHRIALTGTPWRKDPDSPIPFARYDNDGVVVVDYAYEYGAAVTHGVCRRVEFHAYDGAGKWVDCGRIVEAELGADLADDDVAGLLDSLYDPANPWMQTLLEEATVSLEELRREVNDAAGLVVADRQWHARAYAEILHQITGEMPTVVISEDPTAKSAIDEFRTGRAKWIVAVRMVSEGVDIPRLGVGVFASKVRTPLFFRQVVGRIVRQRPTEEFNARLFIPSVPGLTRMAHEIEEELRHQLDAARELDEEARSKAAIGQRMFDLREPISSTDAVFGRAILSGNDFTAEEMTGAESVCQQYGIPASARLGMAKLLRDQGEVTQRMTITPVPDSAPLHRREKALRGEVEALARKIDYRKSWDRGQANKLLYGSFGQRSRASVETLEKMLDYLAGL